MLNSYENLILRLLVLFLIFGSNCYAVPVSVGASYGGGTVFCVTNTPDLRLCRTEGSGEYGLIMANVDQANFDSNAKHGVTWSSAHYETRAVSEDDGAANTAAIIATFSDDNPGNNAAWLSDSYNRINPEPASEHLTRWYLPSKNELNKMYLCAKSRNLIGKGCAGGVAGGVQCLVGGYNGSAWYWSSSEYPGDHYHRGYGAWHPVL